MKTSPLRSLLAALVLLVVLALPARATWSIVVINKRTGEVGVASATCLANFNLRRALPVVVIGRGAAAAQSAIDSSGDNRRLIWQAFRNQDLTSAEILAMLEAQDGSHSSRQYGIVSFNGDPVTFTGDNAGAAASGRTGQVGDYVWAIQGNLLTGDEVVDAAVDAFVNTNSDMSERLMAAMLAARDMGGDGRCSCLTGNATDCGAPPASFTKSAHCGFLIVARYGDTNGVCNRTQGCASGEYYLLSNIAGARSEEDDPDPVDQLFTRYVNWRDRHRGAPDGILSSFESVRSVPADGVTTRTVTVTLRDIDGVQLPTGGATIDVSTVSGNPSLGTIGPVVDHGDGTYSFTITAGTAVGEEQLAIRAEQGEVGTLYPYLDMRYDAVESLHCGFDAVNVANGADVPMVLDVPDSPFHAYLVLASLSGTVPGTTVGRISIPLNSDAVTWSTLLRAGDPGLLPGTIGVTDANGRAEMSCRLNSQQLLALSGLRLDWAGLVTGPNPQATNAVGFDILP